MDERILPAAAVLMLLVVLLVLMYLGWRARKRRQSTVSRPLTPPADRGTELFGLDDALYVATTVRDEPLDRIAVHGLGFRARTSVSVLETGVVLDLAGTPGIYIPTADLEIVGRSTWTIDRVVESGGLIRIGWRLGDTAVDSFLRITEPDDPSVLIDAIDELLATRPAS